MKRILTALVLIMPTLAHGYGSRDWLSANQHYNREYQHHRNIRGLNLMEGASRTTIHNVDDRVRWMNQGNLRNNNSNGLYHWRKELRKRH